MSIVIKNDFITFGNRNTHELNSEYNDAVNNLSTTRLSALKNEIVFLEKETKRNVWLLGQSLSEIKGEKLYKDMEYESFKDYCVNELEFTRQSAYVFIRLYKTFTFEVVSKHSYSKLNEIAKIKDTELRNNLLQRLEDEKLTLSELKKIIHDIKNNTKPQQIKEPSIVKMCKNVKKRFEELELYAEKESTDKEIYEMIELMDFLDRFITNCISNR